MKITVRIPTEAYAFQEVEFDSIEEYKQGMPEFIEAYKQVKKIIINNTHPFDGDEFTK